MAKILVKNSVISGSAPAGLSLGEMAINITDKKIFIGNAVEAAVAIYDPNSHVSSVNGATGAITNVAFTNIAQTFSGLQSFSTGISAAGGTFYGSVNLQNTLLIKSLIEKKKILKLKFFKSEKIIGDASCESSVGVSALEKSNVTLIEKMENIHYLHANAKV